MIEGRLTRRHVVGGISASVLGVALMGGRSAAAQDSTPVSTPATNEGAAFPVTIQHVYGETVIESKPLRVVTLSWINQDVVIALGTIPVGMPFYSWGGDEDGFLPWTRTAIGDNPPPMLLDTVEGIPYEDIVGLDPDVIIGVYSGITQEEYDLLSQIAPTVAYPEVAFGTSWQDVTRIIGQVLGQGEEADQLVVDMEALLANAATEYPQIAGKTFTYGNVEATDGFAIYTTIDPRVQLLESLGMIPSPFVQGLEITGPNPYYVAISLEQANLIDGEILIFWFSSQEEADAAAELPTMQGIPAFVNGAYAPIVGESNVMASSAPSPLSIPYMIDEYVPQLAAAADNVPA